MGSVLPSNIPHFDSSKPPPKQGAPIGGIVVTVILALALVAIIAVAVTRLTGGGLSRPTASAPSTAPTAASTSATPAPAGTPADSATQQAIEQVIQQVDQAQIQAIETNNPNVMQDTATTEFYQEQVSNNQDLTDNGVTDIKLVQIEWGPIEVNGNTATATDYETWSTTFDDGTTEQSRDRNVYTLVQQNGSWKVQEDAHPDQANITPVPSGPGGAP